MKNNYFLTDAIENSDIGYWAEFKNIKRDNEKLIISFDIRDNDDEGERVSEKWHKITFNKILKATEKIKNGEVEIRKDIAQQFIGKPEDWDYDIEGIDCVIQIVVFNELIYG
jgi:hypothetical protein